MDSLITGSHNMYVRHHNAHVHTCSRVRCYGLLLALVRLRHNLLLCYFDIRVQQLLDAAWVAVERYYRRCQ